MRFPRQQRAKAGWPLRPLPAAFTLIEILVVIAVIAVLAAIAFPIASKAMESAHSSKCLSNLRQMHAVVASYMQDNNGQLPHGPSLFITSLWAYAYADKPKPTIGGNILPPDLKGTIFECPMARRDGSSRSYGFNMYYGDGMSSRPKRFISLDRPLSKVCLIADCAEASALTPSRITERHNGLCNVLYADGHVAPTKITEEIRRSDYSDEFWGRYKR
jgi:prepilin-type N-terminal cleavage/methylation domain-containing protein/prepilin-type processing-associated H-X9-DG protein